MALFTLEARDIWIKSVIENCPESTIVAIIANKSDLENKVSLREAQAMASAHNFKFFETSCLTGENVLQVGTADREVFQDVCQEYVNRFLKQKGTCVKHLDPNYPTYGEDEEEAPDPGLSLSTKTLNSGKSKDQSASSRCCP